MTNPNPTIENSFRMLIDDRILLRERRASGLGTSGCAFLDDGLLQATTFSDHWSASQLSVKRLAGKSALPNPTRERWSAPSGSGMSPYLRQRSLSVSDSVYEWWQVGLRDEQMNWGFIGRNESAVVKNRKVKLLICCSIFIPRNQREQHNKYELWVSTSGKVSQSGLLHFYSFPKKAVYPVP